MATARQRDQSIRVNYDQELKDALTGIIRRVQGARFRFERHDRVPLAELEKILRDVRRMAWAASGFSGVGTLSAPEEARQHLRGALTLILGEVDLLRRRLRREAVIEGVDVAAMLLRVEQHARASMSVIASG
jgi:hypothetical protein